MSDNRYYHDPGGCMQPDLHRYTDPKVHYHPPDPVTETFEVGPAERCAVRSSITEHQCLLDEGHPQDSATRFHRFANASSQGASMTPQPIYGCSGCSTSAGIYGCPVHGRNLHFTNTLPQTPVAPVDEGEVLQRLRSAVQDLLRFTPDAAGTEGAGIHAMGRYVLEKIDMLVVEERTKPR